MRFIWSNFLRIKFSDIVELILKSSILHFIHIWSFVAIYVLIHRRNDQNNWISPEILIVTMIKKYKPKHFCLIRIQKLLRPQNQFANPFNKVHTANPWPQTGVRRFNLRPHNFCTCFLFTKMLLINNKTQKFNISETTSNKAQSLKFGHDFQVKE